jgi:C-terminal processing protease CtpA/Prc
MKRRISGALVSCAMLVSACGGGGSGSGGPPSGPIGGTPTPSPTPTATCSLSARQAWAFAQLKEWYLFPETLPASLDPAPFTSVQAYVDALTATARAQRRDRFFTYITSIAEENAFFNSGASAGFGVRLSLDSAARRLFIAEAYEGAPGLNAGLDRGTEILAIGTSEANLRTVSDIIATEGTGGVNNALGPSTVGTSRVLRITDAAGTRVVTVAKAEFTIPPVSPRYGARILEDGGKKVGYVNLRTFIGTADQALRQAFANFRAQGVTEVIVDVRYNGGGLVSIAELMNDLLAANRTSAEVQGFTTFRPEKASNNKTRNFSPQPQSIAAMKIAFIGTPSSASASELVINAFIPYLGANAALIGGNTFGKPVGQIALDRAECDDRLRVVAFKTENAAKQGDYFDGLASKMNVTCKAPDDIFRQLGDPQEGSTRQALDYLAGRQCTAISTGLSTQSVGREGEREMLMPQQPTAAQREMPGLF